MSKRSESTPLPALFEELEPRVLLSADGLAGLAGLVGSDERELEADTGDVIPVHHEFAPASSQEQTSSQVDAKIVRHELVFVDGGIEDHQALVAGFLAANGAQSAVEVVVLDRSRDGIDQISEALAGYQDLDAVHLVSHGDDATLRVGSTTLDSESLDRYRAAITGWAGALDAEADLLLYGCNLAAGEDGRALIAELAVLTGADVAASDDLTGAALLGGDWELEHRLGEIESTVAVGAAAQEAWSQVLVTYTVTSNAATGAGSLDEAIGLANASTGVNDVIEFNIGGGGAQTIVVDSGGLPAITDTVIIDATTQPGYAGDPLITLDGSNTANNSGINGIVLRADNSTIKGFRVHSFADEGIEIDGSTGKGDNNTIQNNWVGIDELGVVRGNAEHGIMVSVDAENNQIGGAGPNEGNVVAGNGFDRGTSSDRFSGIIIRDNSNNNVVEGNIVGLMPDGDTLAGNGENGIVIVDSSDGNRIGGTAAGAGNVVSGNALDGIRIDGSPNPADGNVVQGNFIGTDITGTFARGNGDDGISIQGGATNNTIGGASAAARNVISGNDAAGVYLAGATTTGNLIQGNYIGTDVNGTADLGNGKVIVEGNVRTFDAGTNTIGGTGAGEGNVIAFGGSDGVEIQGTSSGIAILGNSIFSNAGLGIDINGDGVDVNDGAKPGAAPNLEMDNPVFTSVSLVGGTLTITGYVGSAPDQALFANSRVEIFRADSDPSVFAEGETYLGFLITDANGNFSGSIAAAGLASSDRIIATATDTSNNTSEFGSAVSPEHAPTAANNTVATDEDTSYPLTVADFNFSDVDTGDTLQQVQITSLPSVGTLKLSGADVALNQVIGVADIVAGNLIFTPVTGQNGVGYDSFEFKVSDGTAIAAAGAVLDSFAAPVVNSMSGLAFDGTNIWLVGQSTDTVYELDTDGNILSTFSAPGTNPTGLTFDGTNLWLVDRDLNTIYELDTAGNVLSSFATPGTDSRGLTFDGTNLWLVEGTGSQIYELTTTGSVVSSFAWPDDYMRGITWDGTSLLVADRNDDLIYELNTVGTVLSSFAAPSTGAAGLTADGQALWHADADTDVIYRLAGPNSSLYSATAYTMTVDVTPVNDAPTFATPGDGSVVTQVGSSSDYGYSVTVQPDGKSVVGGYSWTGSSYDFVVTRYNVDGSLDSSFGGGDGVATIDIGTGSDLGFHVTLQPDGKILLAGAADNGVDKDFALTRLNSDGTLDATFDGDGIVTTDIGVDDDYGKAMALQADGKIVVAGFTRNGTNNNFAVIRYNGDGSLDTSFDGDGIVTTAVPSFSSHIDGIALQADGKIVVIGDAQTGGGSDFAVVRYNANGSLDTSFGGSGIVTTSIGTTADPHSIAVQADGKILAGGYAYNGTSYEFAVVRYEANGTLDFSFGGGDGIATISTGSGDDRAYNMAVLPDGKIVLSGTSDNGTDNDFSVARLNSDGSLDTSFGGGDGFIIAPVGGANDTAYGMAIAPDGSILLAGSIYNGSDSDFALQRFTSDGVLDTSFDPVNTLDGAPTFTENGPAVVLDADVQVFDEELSAADNFSAATLTLARNAGANGDDLFSATGTLGALTQGGNLVVGATTIGTVTTNSAGMLVLTFNGNATHVLVNAAMQQIAYSNSSDTPPASAQIDWTFDDGNAGAQGTGGALQANGSTTVDIVATNDDPTGAGSLTTSNLNDNAGATNLFGGLTVSDGDAGENDLSLTITLTDPTAGNLTGGGFTETGPGTGVYTITGLTAAQANSALDNAQFTPTNNTGPSGIFTTDISVTVNDQGGGGEQSVLAATTLTITRVNDNPSGAGSLTATSLNENAGATNLFGGLSVSDVDAGESDLSLTITLTNPSAGTLAGGGFIDLGAGVYRATGLTVAQADTALDNVQFTPTDNSGPVTLDISVTVNDQDSGEQSVLGPTTVTITRVNDNPTGAGSLTTTSLNDNAGATNLFGGLSVSDVDTGENDLSVTITLTDPTAGAVSGGGFVDLGGGVYRATGLTVAQADTALDTVQFTPTNNTGSSGTFNTNVSVTVNDQGGGGEQSVLGATTLTITRINDNPTGAGSLTTTSVNDNAGATNLFGGLSVSDVDVGEADLSVTITLTNPAAGALSGGGFVDLGAGVYRTTGLTVAQADTALDNVTFTPVNNTAPSGSFTTDISVTVNDQDSGEQSVLGATTVTITRINDNPTGAGSLTTTSLNDNAGATNLFGGLAVSDVDVGENDLSVTITLTNPAAGALSGGGFVDLGAGVYRATGLTVAQADTALDNVTFTPVDNTGPSGSFTTDISVTVNDQDSGEQSVLGATTVTITRINDNPTGAGSLTTTSLNDNAGATNLFGGLSVSDVDAGENDLSVTITLTDPTAGTLSGGGFVDLGGGVYRATGLTVAQADTALDNVTFTPTDNTGPAGTFTTNITVTVNDQDSGEQGVLGLTTVTITRINDDPGGAGSLTATSLNDNAGATNLFGGLSVSDVDAGENDLSVTITLTNPAAGTISGGGFVHLGGGVYRATGLTVAQADTALDNVQFAPVNNTGPSGTFNTDISVTVNDQDSGEQSVLALTTVTITRVNDNPTGAGTLTATSLDDNDGATNLFGGLSVSDVDAGENDLSVTITLTNPTAGTISGGGFVALGGGVYRATGLTAAQADTALDNVQFTPTDNTGPSGTFNTGIGVTVNDQDSGEQSVLGVTTVTITRVNDNPTGAGSLTTTSLNDNAGATNLFGGLTVSDVDVGEADLSVTITLTNPAAGALSGGGFVDLGGGVYRATGLTVAQADTALDNVTFTPVNNTAPSGSFTTDISVTVNDQDSGEQSVLALTTVTITRVNDNPTGAGTLTTTSLNENAGPTNLFGGLTVSDLDAGESDLALTITLTDPTAGILSGGGFVDLGGGVYRVTGLTVAQADTALDNVQFTPTDNNGPATLDISVTVNDQDSGEQSVLAPTTVTITGVNDDPTGSGSLTTTSLNDNAGATNLFGGLSVSDVDAGENDLSVTITLTSPGAGSLSGGGFIDLGAGVYRATGLTVAQADTALDNVQFTPTNNTGSSGTFNTNVSVTVNDQGGGGEQSVLGATTVTITRVNDNPGGVGALTTTSLNDNAGATNLFGGLSVSDVDAGESDLSVTITLTDPAAGTLSGGGFVDLGAGVYRATGLTVAQADTALDNVQFTPTDNTGPSGTFTTDISVTVNDQGGGGEQDVLTATTVTITRVNDDPTGAGTLTTTSLNDNAGASNLFGGLTVSDVDAGENDLSLTMTLTDPSAGTLSGGGFVETGPGTGIYTIAGLTVAQADTALDNVQFTPTDNTGPSGNFTTDISVTVNDQGGGGERSVLGATTVTITRINDDPSGAGTLTTTSLNDNAGASNLFGGLTVADVDPGENDLSLTITLTDPTAGTLSGGGFTETGPGSGVYTVGGLTVAAADTALDNVQFTPTDNSGPSGTFTTDISVTVNDQGGGGERSVLGATTVTITRVNDDPAGAGTLTTTSLNDNAGASNLFGGLTVSDADAGENDLSLIVTLTDPSAGTLSGGGFVETGPGTGVYTIAGLTVAQADTALDNVQFTPTDNTGPSGTFTTDISVTVNDQGGGGERSVLGATTVTITRVNDDPAGAGTLTTTALNDNAGASNLFGGLTVSDADAGENDLSLTITLTDPSAGTLSGGGFVETGPGTGVYTIAGLTVAQADTALDNVQFTPTDNTGPSGTFTTDISVTVNDQGGGGERSVLGATTVTITRVNDDPAGAGTLTTTSLNDNAGASNLFGGLTVSDVDAGENDLSLTITLTDPTAGTLSGGGFTETAPGSGVYTIAGLTVAQADTALDNVQFTPTDNTGPSGTFTTDISVTVNDQGGGGERSVLGATTVTITRVNDDPAGAGTLTTTALNDNAGASNLFGGLTVSDVDAGENDLSLTITLTNAGAGTISGGGFTDLGGGAYQATSLTVAAADTALDNVTFTPTDNTGPSGNFSTDISVTVNDQGGGGERSVFGATTVTITRVNDDPAGAGTLTTTSLNDNAGASNLFGGLTVSDVDAGENDLSLTITLTDPTAGTLSGGGFTEIAPGSGVYTVGGLTVGQADTALDSVQFTPTNNTGPVGTFTTDISVTVNDQGGGGERSVLSPTTVTITRVNVAPMGLPVIIGTAGENLLLTAQTAGISDADGLGAFSYQWLRGGVAIATATSATYTLGNADVGASIAVRVDYSDGDGKAESVTSAPLGPVTAASVSAPTPVPVPAPDLEVVPPPGETVTVEDRETPPGAGVVELSAVLPAPRDEIVELTARDDPEPEGQLVSQGARRSLEQAVVLLQAADGSTGGDRDDVSHGVSADARELLLQAAQQRELGRLQATEVPSRALDDFRIADAALTAQVEQMTAEMTQSGERDIAEQEFTQKVLKGTLGTLSVGTVTWLLRAGSLLTGVFSVIPMWTSMDPLPILAMSRKEKQRRQKELAKAGSEDAGEQRMGHLLGGQTEVPEDREPPP